VPGTSLLILSFPLSSAMGGGSGIAGLTNAVLEVEECQWKELHT
jgi:hypothetical protein